MRVIGTIIAALLYVIGFLAGWLDVALRWLWSALAVGWDDAHRLATRGRQRRPEGADEAETEVRVPDWPAERPRAA